MMKRSGLLILPCGTLSCDAVASAMREVGKHPKFYNAVTTRMVDTGWDAPGLNAVDPMQKINLAHAPIRELRENPHHFGSQFGMVMRDQLGTALDQPDAGHLV